MEARNQLKSTRKTLNGKFSQSLKSLSSLKSSERVKEMMFNKTFPHLLMMMKRQTNLHHSILKNLIGQSQTESQEIFLNFSYSSKEVEMESLM